MHSPLYEMLSLPIPVRFPVPFSDCLPFFRVFVLSLTYCPSKVCGVSCGPSHCLMVTRGGSLWAWGSGTLGQVYCCVEYAFAVWHLTFLL
jgi:hypothetical protein